MRAYNELIKLIYIIGISIFLFRFGTVRSELDKKPKAILLKDIQISSENDLDRNKWQIYDLKNKNKNNIYWKKYYDELEIENLSKTGNSKNHIKSVGTLNRSIVFNDKWVGPDISWIIPPGLKWNKKYKFDIYARGHNTVIPEPATKNNFFAWNDGDAVGLISYQFLHREKSSFGLNLGIRSLYQGTEASGGDTSIGEGLSAGFRWDYALSDYSGFAFGAEQLLHFDSLTDTGRNLYLTFTKAWWKSEYNGIGIFPLDIATAGIGTGRMSVGNIKGFCSNLLGGSGTEIYHQRSLCWAPIFSVARVWNKKLSTFFEYNSRFFLLGSSIAPSQQIPVRSTFALILSDHADNYKLHNGSEINWVFNLSVGF